VPLGYWEYSSGLTLEEFDPDDMDEAARVNPAWDILLNAEFIEETERGFLTAEELARERFGIFDVDSASQWMVISETAWERGRKPDSKRAGAVVFALEVAEDRSWSTIGACGKNPQGLLHGEVIANEPRTAWVVPRMAELVDKHNPPAVLVAKGSPAESLVPDLLAAGLKMKSDGGVLVVVTVAEQAQACGQMYDDVTADTPGFCHIGQPLLDVAVRTAKWKATGDAQIWARRTGADIAPLVAVTLARFGFVLYGDKTTEVPNLW
jgi:hypothetical protein